MSDENSPIQTPPKTSERQKNIKKLDNLPC